MHRFLTVAGEVMRQFLTVAGEVMRRFLTVPGAVMRWFLTAAGEVMRRDAARCVGSLLRCAVDVLGMAPRVDAMVMSRTVLRCDTQHDDASVPCWYKGGDVAVSYCG